LTRLGCRWRRRRTVALASVIASAIGVTVPLRAVIAQGAASPAARWWPSSADTDGSTLAAFGNVIHCNVGQCDRAASLGLDARLVGGLRVAVDTRMPGFDYGVSYGWRHIGLAASVGRGAYIVLAGVQPRTIATVRSLIDTAGRVSTDTVPVPVADSTTRDATRWSSAEARLTWREARWWATALVGRVAVAQHGAAIWGGLQFGADIGRGAALLLGVGTTSRLLAAAEPEWARHNVSLGLGFNTAILSPRRNGSLPNETAGARAAFAVSNMGAGRIRITIRVPSASAVAFAADCTGWKPVEMTRTRDGWMVEVAATRGLHQANIRIDGGRWIAPPGLASAADDFAGEVGIFVVE